LQKGTEEATSCKRLAMGNWEIAKQTKQTNKKKRPDLDYAHTFFLHFCTDSSGSLSFFIRNTALLAVMSTKKPFQPMGSYLK